jgi:hypothetical protein
MKIRILAAMVLLAAAVGPSPAMGSQQCVRHHGKRVCRATTRSSTSSRVYRAAGFVNASGIQVAAVTTGSKPTIQGGTVSVGKPGSPLGVYCISIQGSGASVAPAIASPAGATPAEGAPSVAWIPYAPDCAHVAVEIRTWTIAVSGAQTTLVPSDKVSFTFIVPT